MLRIVAAALVLATGAFAQDLDFSGINSAPTGAPQAVALTAPPAAASGQGAPYWGYSSYEYGGWNNQNYGQYQQLKWRYDSVHAQVKQVRGWYRSGSYERMSIDRSLNYGESLWSQYRRYQDPNSAYQLQVWCSQWDQYLAQLGYQQGGWYSRGGGWYDDNRYYDNRYQYRDYGYYDTYDRYYYGNNGYYGNGVYYGNSAYTDGLMLGNSIGHIVNGSRYDNGLELTGGVLGTIGNTLNIFNNARGW